MFSVVRDSSACMARYTINHLVKDGGRWGWMGRILVLKGFCVGDNAKWYEQNYWSVESTNRPPLSVSPISRYLSLSSPHCLCLCHPLLFHLPCFLHFYSGTVFTLWCAFPKPVCHSYYWVLGSPCSTGVRYIEFWHVVDTVSSHMKKKVKPLSILSLYLPGHKKEIMWSLPYTTSEEGQHMTYCTVSLFNKNKAKMQR